MYLLLFANTIVTIIAAFIAIIMSDTTARLKLHVSCMTGSLA